MPFSWTFAYAMVMLVTSMNPVSAKECSACLERCNSAWVFWKGQTFHWGYSSKYNRWLKYDDPKHYIVVESGKNDWTSKKALWSTCKCLNGEHYETCQQQPVYKEVSELPSAAQGYVKAGYVLGTGSDSGAPASSVQLISRPKTCNDCLGRCDSFSAWWTGKVYYWGYDKRRDKWIKYADASKLLIVESSKGDMAAKKSLASICRCFNGDAYRMCSQTPIYKRTSEMPSALGGYVKAGYIVGDAESLTLLETAAASPHRPHPPRQAELLSRKATLLAELTEIDSKIVATNASSHEG